MSIYMGIDCTPTGWHILLAEDEIPLEWEHFQESEALQSYLQQTNARYPEARVAITTPHENKFTSLSQLRGEPSEARFAYEDVHPFLPFLPRQSYLLPSIQYLPTIEAHRRLMRPSSGSAAILGHIAYLLYQMKKQDATWLELTFYYLELLDDSYRLVVLKHGQLVDGIGEWKVQPVREHELEDVQRRNEVVKQALLEQLTRDLAAMMTIHHLEDIVVLDHTRQSASSQKETIIDHFSDRYRFFLYPPTRPALVGFEAAQGAALLAYGLSRPGLAAEVARQLFAIADTEHFNAHRQ